jgi:hypothetical protein
MRRPLGREQAVLTGKVSPVVTHSEAGEGRSGTVEPTKSESSEPAKSESRTQPVPRQDGSSDEDPQLEKAEQELRRQREEMAALHKQLDTRGRRQRRITLLRQIVAAVLVFVAALGTAAPYSPCLGLTLRLERRIRHG